MDLFQTQSLQDLPGTPLAERVRPKSLTEMVGQDSIRKQIDQFLKQGFLPNLILWGPPGTGKTTLAQILASEVRAEFVSLNAVETGAKALKEEGENARIRRRLEGRQTLLFVDEIHRLNKAQQDVLLPFLEQGDLRLIGATTENPSYEINRALLSRCKLLVFQALSPLELTLLFDRHRERLGWPTDFLSDEGLQSFLLWVDGDARKLLSALEEIHFEWQGRFSEGPLSWEQIQKTLGARALAYDKNSDQHYDLISAFIKSLRGSDPNAALYWLARMVEGGEDPVFIARRMVILASEDVGNADPRALSLAVDAAKAVEMIGWPEGAIILAQACTYLALAPKSNRSYAGWKEAQSFVQRTGSLPVPLHLRSSKTALMKSIGYGEGYQYPHDHSKGWVPQHYLPEGVANLQFYEPSDLGFEKNMKAYQEWRQGQSTPKKKETES